MRRKFRGTVKFLLLTVLTVATTAFVFRLIRQPQISRARFVSHEDEYEATAFKNVLREEKIDWHNYDQIRADAFRTGIGEQGKPAFLPDEFLQEKEALYKVNGFNALLSDKIQLNRSLPDIRHPGCKNKMYRKQLNVVSVVVPFHNEHWSTLLRTVYSVINRSPPHLLKEIILVDDFSSKEFLKEKLDSYVKKFLPKVKIIRLGERMGLIRARVTGAKAAAAEVLVFLDSHTEANVNWLPPLLDPIAEDYRTCVCPFIDVIAHDTFEYREQDNGRRGAFDWEFFYKRLPLLPEDLEHPTEPFLSPVMAGGLFAISAKFFWELGGYDKGLDIWGGEQYELSFKIWQCGGKMVDAPCSRVGHIYRKFAPFPDPGRGDFVGKNYRRVAEVWMDEYAEYLYMRRPHYRKIDPGDLTEQKALREKLHCKPFKWFMENIAFDLPLKYPPIEPPDTAQGEIRSLEAPHLCVDTENKGTEKPFGLRPCAKDGKHRSPRSEQYFRLTWHKDVRPRGRNVCWDVSSVDDRAPVTLFNCHGMQGNQLWKYKSNEKWLVHGVNPRCLTADVAAKGIYVSNCDRSLLSQRWKIEKVNLTATAREFLLLRGGKRALVIGSTARASAKMALPNGRQRLIAELWQKDLSSVMRIGRSTSGYGGVSLRCGPEHFAVNVSLAEDFRGVVYTRGSFSEKKPPCFKGHEDKFSTGSSESVISLRIPFHKCGTVMDVAESLYTNTLVIQHETDLIMPGDAAFRLDCAFAPEFKIKGQLGFEETPFHSRITLVDADPSGGSTGANEPSSSAASRSDSVSFVPTAREEL